jgi:hypothetical protein
MMRRLLAGARSDAYRVSGAERSADGREDTVAVAGVLARIVAADRAQAVGQRLHGICNPDAT